MKDKNLTKYELPPPVVKVNITDNTVVHKRIFQRLNEKESTRSKTKERTHNDVIILN